MIRFSKIFFIIIFLVVFGCQSGIQKNSTDNVESNQSADSVELLTEMIKLDSANYQLFAQRSRLQLEKGQIDKAFRDLSYAIDMNPNDPGLFILLGDIYFIIGKKENCLQSYRKAAKLDPGSEAPLLKLAEVHLILKEYDQALQFIERSIVLNVNNPKSFYLKGIQRMETGDTANALINLKLAGNLDSTYFEAYMQTASLYSALNDSISIDYYQAALKASPNEERALMLLASSYQQFEKFGLALDTYLKIDSIYPTNKIANFNAGYIYMVEMMDFELALESFNKTLAIDPSYVDAVYNIGRIYEERGEYDLARIHYRQSLGLVTNYPLAIEGLNRIDEIQP